MAEATSSQGRQQMFHRGHSPLPQHQGRAQSTVANLIGTQAYRWLAVTAETEMYASPIRGQQLNLCIATAVQTDP